MAKFHNYHVLCPLIDQNSFLGISLDKDDQCVIVTLGRNVVNKYRISDQKQISGWTSKDHITSNVIYDKNKDAYVGVFNNNTIKTWNDDSDNLDKVKKHKFSTNIIKLLPTSKRSSLIIFTNGNCVFLDHALDNRKTLESKPVITEHETIIETYKYYIGKANYMCYIIKNDRDEYEILISRLRAQFGDIEKSKLERIQISRIDDVHIVSKLIDELSVFILWSDSKLTVFNLIDKTWKNVGTVPWVSMQSNVSMASMQKKHLILFGTSLGQDGAIIVAYNIELGVGSCKYPMKMYSENAKLYCFQNHVILESANHIGMLPYVLETKRNVSTLLGSHEITVDESTVFADWGMIGTPEFRVCDEIEPYLKQGLSERAICSQIIPPLLEKESYDHVFKVLKEFKDIPESILVSLLNYAIKLVDSKEVDICNQLIFTKHCSSKDLEAQFAFLNHILQIPFCDALLVPYLKNNFPLDNALFTIKFIGYLLIDYKESIDIDYENKLYNWCTILMDSFYQQFIISNDLKVETVLRHKLLLVKTLLRHLDSVDGVMPLLNQLLLGRINDETDNSNSYTIELMYL